jgi:Carboxypeptidase regulatory-like domain
VKNELIKPRFPSSRPASARPDVIAEWHLLKGLLPRLPTMSFCRPLLLSALASLVFMCFQSADAQYTTARLSGTVLDHSGAAVTGAAITVVNTGNGLAKSISTGDTGTFSFPALPVGSYQLTVEKSGFSTYVQKGIVLTVDQAATLRVNLKVGADTQQVLVTANAGMLTTSTGTVTQLIDQKSVTDLPLDGRQANTLVFLAPGTANTTNNYCLYNCQGGVYPSSQEASVNGGGTANVNYQLDGTDHNDNYVNSNLPFPNPDAVQEFTLQSSNMGAEYGNSANVVDIVTRSGTNQFHGDAFEFIRNGDLNGRDYFASVQDTLKRNQFGGAIGGPIKRDRLFFFGTYQGTRITEATAGNVAIVPTAAERQGDFGDLCSAFDTSGLCESGDGTQLVDPVSNLPIPYNQISQARLSQPALKLLQQIPGPNGPNGQLTFPGPTLVQNDDQFMPKIDWISGRNQLSGRYFYSNFKEPVDIAAGQQNLLALDGNGTAVKVQTVSFNDSFAFSPTLLFSTWFGWDTQVGGGLTGAATSFASYGIQIAAPAIPQMDGLTVGGYFNFSSSHFGDFNRGDKTVREIIHWQKARHELIVGGSLTRVNQNISNTNTQGGSFGFSNQLSGSNLADFMLGQASSFVQGGGQYQNYIGGLYSLFIQDNWRVNPKLTLNVGLRWDPYWPYTETKNRMNCYVPGEQSRRYPNAPEGMIFGGDPGCPSGRGMFSDVYNFGPRLGFAYHPVEHTVVRGGAGIYYTSPQTSQQNGVAAAAPFAPRFRLSDVSFEDPYGSAGVTNPFPADFGGVVPGPGATFTLPVFINNTLQRNFRISSLATWNVSVEREFGKNWLLSIGYVGNVGYDLSSNQEGEHNANPAIYIPGQSTEDNTQERRINPNFGEIYLYNSGYHSNYNALQVNFQRRFSRGLSILANYTWSHLLDNFAPSQDLETDPFDRNFDRGNSLDNVPNIFHLSGIWQIPHPSSNGFAGRFVNGWELTSIVNWQNGFPFTLYCGCDNSFSGVGYDRPDFTGNSLSEVQLGKQSRSQMINEYFNTSFFVPNAVGTYGNIQKNVLSGPRFFDTDLGLIKDTKITEATTFQLRAEFFNAFNNVNFNPPGGTLGTGTFGQITSTSGPTAGTFRVIQFAGKIIF